MKVTPQHHTGHFERSGSMPSRLGFGISQKFPGQSQPESDSLEISQAKRIEIEALKPGDRVYFLPEELPLWILNYQTTDPSRLTQQVMQNHQAELCREVTKDSGILELGGFYGTPCFFIPKAGATGNRTGTQIPINALFCSEESFKSALQQKAATLLQTRQELGPAGYMSAYMAGQLKI